MTETASRPPVVTLWSDLEIVEDGATIAAIDASRKRSDSVLAAIDRWNIDDLLQRAVTAERPATFDEMMPLWVGNAALRPVPPERQEAYACFLRQHRLSDRFNAIVDAMAADRGALLECDLGPAHDFVLIEKHLELLPQRSDPLIVLEVGGGYGRLAELFLRYARRPLCYVLADGIPESVYYSWAYLRARLPQARIGAHFSGEGFAPHAQDVYIAPAWTLPESLPAALDVALNVASIQEMPEATATAYFALFAQKLRLGGLFFFENSREFFYSREYAYPDQWRYLMKQISPRSRTLDYPVDLLQTTDADQGAPNKRVIESYYIALKQQALATVEQQKGQLREQRRALSQVRLDKAAQLKARHDEMARLRRDKAAQIGELRTRHAAVIAKLRQRITKLGERDEARLRTIESLRQRIAALGERDETRRRIIESLRQRITVLGERDQARRREIESLRHQLVATRAEAAAAWRPMRRVRKWLKALHQAR